MMTTLHLFPFQFVQLLKLLKTSETLNFKNVFVIFSIARYTNSNQMLCKSQKKKKNYKRKFNDIYLYIYVIIHLLKVY